MKFFRPPSQGFTVLGSEAATATKIPRTGLQNEDSPKNCCACCAGVGFQAAGLVDGGAVTRLLGSSKRVDIRVSIVQGLLYGPISFSSFFDNALCKLFSRFTVRDLQGFRVAFHRDLVSLHRASVSLLGE